MGATGEPVSLLCCAVMNRFIRASWWYRCWCVYEGCSPKLSSSSCRNSKLSRVIGLLLVLKNALMNMLVAEKPVAADAEDDDVTSDDEVMAEPSFCDASRNMSTKGSIADDGTGHMWTTLNEQNSAAAADSTPPRYDECTAVRLLRTTGSRSLMQSRLLSITSAKHHGIRKYVHNVTCVRGDRTNAAKAVSRRQYMCIRYHDITSVSPLFFLTVPNTGLSTI